MTPKCGQLKVWHWAHRSIRSCDPWWENETPWHRAWKNQFPADWQEKVHRTDNGEKHVADVKTKSGVVLEFQHSPLPLRNEQRGKRFIGTWSGSCARARTIRRSSRKVS